MKRAFTLIELLVVMAIIVILAAVAVPAIKSLTKNNSQAQAVNQIRAQISAARTIALSQHRKAGVVFFDETPEFSNPTYINANQTAMQIFVEDYNQAQYAPGQNITVYVTYTTDRQYLPQGIMVGALGMNPDPAHNSEEAIRTGDNSTAGVGINCRCILFDATGQLIIENNMATPLRKANYSFATRGQFQMPNPTAYGDWRFTDPTSTGNNANPWIPGNASSENALFVFNKTDYNAQSFSGGVISQRDRTLWLEQHSDCIVINPYTGNVIR